MDLGENVSSSITNEAVGMPCKTKVDGTAGASAEPVCVKVQHSRMIHQEYHVDG